MPLTMLTLGKSAIVKGYRNEGVTKRYLEGLGIIPGTSLRVISEMSGNLIIVVKGSRLALNKGIAQQLLVTD